MANKRRRRLRGETTPTTTYPWGSFPETEMDIFWELAALTPSLFVQIYQASPYLTLGNKAKTDVDHG